ncbi:hypothetical protein VH15_01450 [Corynebacterium ulcerans]|nr:hypothetical protein VH15_01450 [Corynebacterium ulcerans]
MFGSIDRYRDSFQSKTLNFFDESVFSHHMQVILYTKNFFFACLLVSLIRTHSAPQSGIQVQDCVCSEE